MLYTVSVVLPEDASADAVTDIVRSIMNNAHREITSISGFHNLTMIKTEDTRVSSDTLAATKREAMYTLSEITTFLSNNEKTLNDQQKLAYEAIRVVEADDAVSESKESAASTAIAAPGFNSKFALIGFILGAVLYIGAYVIYMMCKKVVASASSAQNYTGTRVLADIYRQADHSGLSGLFASKGIAKYRYKNKLDIDAQISLLANTVMALCDHNNIDRLAILKSGVSDGFDETINSLTAKLKSNDNIKLEVLDADNIDEKTMSDFSNALYAVSGETKLSSLDRLHALIHDYDVATFGTIYMDEL